MSWIAQDPFVKTNQKIMKIMQVNGWQRVLLTLLFSAALLPGFSQALSKVEGVISNEAGEPLKGVSIVYNVVPGNATTTTTSGENGRFSISNLQVGKKYRFVFTYVGYEAYNVPVLHIQQGESNKLIIRMKEASKGMDEVVVVGYGKMKKRDVTGAVSSVKSDQIVAFPVTNMVDALQGRVAGVMVQTTSWTPGASGQIRVRGNRSINADNNPLYVIDGIPTVDALDQISPNDIESVEVLKDASATAIYGNRGANGVILITTKRGRKGKTIIDFNSYYGVQKNRTMPELMDAASFVEYSREAQRNVLGGTYDSKPNKTLDFQNDQLVATPYMSRNMERAWASGTYDASKLVSTNWIDYGLRTGNIQNYSLNLRGGTDNTRFMVSGDYLGNQGVVVDQSFKRYNVRLNLEHNVTNKIKVGTNSIFTASAQQAGYGVFDGYGLKSFNPLASPYNDDSTLAIYPTNNTRTPNPVTDFGKTKRDRNQNRYLGSYYGEVEILPGLSFRSNLGLDLRLYQNYDFNAENTESSGGANTPSSAANSNVKKFGYTWENLLTYQHSFAKDHNLNVTMLQSIQEEKAESNNISVKDLPYDDLGYYNMGSALTINSVGTGLMDWKLSSFMGRVNYGFKGKYLATISARYDGSSRLAEGEKWVLFPSMALGWRLKGESFLASARALSELKLRVGYGKTGNTSIDPYKTWGRVGTNRYVFGETNILGFTPIEMINPNLTWETTDQFNAGLDFGFFNDRITGALDVYMQNTHNLLLNRQLPTASGFSSILSNIGKTSNKGIELSLNTVNIRNAHFQWRSNIQFAANKQEIVELWNGKNDDVGSKWFIGKPVNIYYDLGFDGIWQNTKEDMDAMAKFNANGATFKPGDIRPLDKNGDFKINDGDRYIIGQADPKWTFSLDNSFVYNNFDASIFLVGMFGQTLNHDLDMRFDGRYNQPKLNYWTPENPSTVAPRPLLNVASVNYLSTMNYYSGDFIRVKNIALGYSLSPATLRKLSLQKLRFYASVQNPFLFTKFPGTDPEGATGFNNPSVKTFTFGLNLSL